MIELNSFDDGNFGLLVLLFQLLAAVRIGDAANQGLCFVEERPHLANGFQQTARLRWELRVSADTVLAVVPLAPRFQPMRGEEPRGYFAVAGGADRRPLVVLFEQLQVPAALERDVRPGVAGTARSNDVAPMHRAGRISAIQDAPVRPERIRACRVPAVAVVAAHVVPRVRRRLPFHQVTGSVGVSKMATGAIVLLRRRRGGSRKTRARMSVPIILYPPPYSAAPGLTAPSSRFSALLETTPKDSWPGGRWRYRPGVNLAASIIDQKE